MQLLRTSRPTRIDAPYLPPKQLVGAAVQRSVRFDPLRKPGLADLVTPAAVKQSPE